MLRIADAALPGCVRGTADLAETRRRCATLAKDTSDCQAAAEREAVRRYPHSFGYAPAVGGMAGLQRDETNRSTVEASSFKACMEGRGYARS